METIVNPVLVVIDLQKGFLNQHSEHILPNIIDLIKRSQYLGIPIVFSRYFNFVDSPFEKLIGWKQLHQSHETELAEEVIEFADVCIDKNFYTSLTDEFRGLIQTNNWKTVILGGIATESCVLKTAADIFEYGLRPIVISDACASDLGEGSHKAGLMVLTSLIGEDQIMTREEFFRNEFILQVHND